MLKLKELFPIPPSLPIQNEQTSFPHQRNYMVLQHRLRIRKRSNSAGKNRDTLDGVG